MARFLQSDFTTGKTPAMNISEEPAMKIFATTILAVALGAVAAPSFAAIPHDANAIKVTYNAKSNKYCVSQLVTGSRLPHHDCRSKEAWAKEGLLIGQSAVKLAQR